MIAPRAARCGAKLWSGVASMKASSMTSRPPLSAKCRASGCRSAGAISLPSGLLGLTRTPTSASARARMSPTFSTASARCPPDRGVLAIGGLEDHDALCRKHPRQPLDQRLRPGRSDYFGAGRDPISPGSDRLQLAKLIRLRQPRPNLRRERRQRIGDRIDAGRQIDPRLRRVRKTPARPVEIAAMRERAVTHSLFPCEDDMVFATFIQ